MAISHISLVFCRHFFVVKLLLTLFQIGNARSAPLDPVQSSSNTNLIAVPPPVDSTQQIYQRMLASTLRASPGFKTGTGAPVPTGFGSQPTAQERLYQRIISNEQLTRPDLTDIPINVTVRVILIKLQDLVEKSELMETTVRVQIGWRDKRLAWDKTEFGGITEILLPSSSVWIPDLAVINSVSDVYSVVRDTRFEIKVESDGQLWWHPTGVLRTFCKLQLSYFPFDRQKCSIIIESPTFDRRFLNLRLRAERTPVDLRMYVESETWRLEKTFGTSQHIKAGVSTYFSRIEFWLIIERARLYHSINFILPCFILSAIQTVFFFLPATHPQRVGSTTVTMLSVMVFQSMVVAQLPKTSESVPLLSIYIDIVILVSATSVCASIFTALCNFNHDRRASVPGWLQNCCGWQRRRPKVPKSHLVKSSSKQDSVGKSSVKRTSNTSDQQSPRRSAAPPVGTLPTALPPTVHQLSLNRPHQHQAHVGGPANRYLHKQMSYGGQTAHNVHYMPAYAHPFHGHSPVSSYQSQLQVKPRRRFSVLENSTTAQSYASEYDCAGSSSYTLQALDQKPSASSVFSQQLSRLGRAPTNGRESPVTSEDSLSSDLPSNRYLNLRKMPSGRWPKKGIREDGNFVPHSSNSHSNSPSRLQQRYSYNEPHMSREDRVRRKSMQAEGFSIVAIPSPVEEQQRRLNCCSESEEMTVFAAVPVGPENDNVLTGDSDNDDDDDDDNRDDVASDGKRRLTWIDVLDCINMVLGIICALSITLGPALIFGVIPNVVDHQDFPMPIGENFTLLTNAQFVAHPDFNDFISVAKISELKIHQHLITAHLVSRTTTTITPTAPSATLPSDTGRGASA